jgi:heme/copper-type cytochrome/quinol oxidase subunit 1
MVSYALYVSSFRKFLPDTPGATRADQEQVSFKSENSFDLLFNLGLWIKLRLIYYVNNWVYTTNHKRIAVNYYFFVIFSGICGMVLATIIRLEMAYPGVGILAGDSLQYLSVVTAHAVIMVFFMIMPLLFGAFGNFLLPTQLGVHDVAFPRLNSAAFWFLPAGLLMLVQLVCLDRRYQRMNCYNIREIQTILKSKYSPNTADAADVHFGLEDTAVGTRYFLSSLEFIDTSLFSFYKSALVNSPRYRAWHEFLHKPIIEFDAVKLFMSRCSFMFGVLQMMYEDESLSILHLFGSEKSTLVSGPSTLAQQFVPSIAPTQFFSVNFSEVASSFDLRLIAYTLTPGYILERLLMSVEFFASDVLHTAFASQKRLLISCLSFASEPVTIIFTIPSSLEGYFHRFLSSLYSSFYFPSSPVLSESYPLIANMPWSLSLISGQVTEGTSQSSQGSFTYVSDDVSTSVTENCSSSLSEELSDQRFVRFMNPVFQYDFKVGNYIPDDAKKLNPHLFMTIKDVTTGIRKSSWFTSNDYSRLLQANIASHMLYFTDCPLYGPKSAGLSSATSDLDSTFAPNSYNSTNVSFTGGFYNFSVLLTSSSDVLNSRWLAVSALDQKFYRMFATSSLQQRIHANWRQLKFTREAWRCKLLAARHQNTLYKRYLNEDSVVWAVERNAKDVLPGWAMITPFSARSRFTAIGKVDIGLMGVFLVLNSSIVSSANFLVTYRYLSTLNNRKMRDARSFFTEGVMVASWMMIAANPMLAIGILMLLSDRHWQTSFFDYSGGGDTVLFQHMFWFFGHPEVYVIMIPTFGFNNTILSFYLRKRVSARASLLYSMYTIAFLGFFVWGHHMYMVGLAHTTRMLFSTLTVMISVPAATKLMHWCVTLVNSSFVLELPMVFQLLFIFFFVSGGISGMAVAHTGMDILFHDSFYVVGHFHVMLAGSAMLASFGAFYFYFPAIFGVKYSRIYGYLHCLYYLIGQLMTVIPMFWLGYAAMPRRVLDYPAALGGWHAVVSAGHMLSVAGMMAFFIMIFDSIRQGRAATRNSFGVARFNTRLNFYIYEGARTWFIQRKGWYLSRFNRHSSVRMNKLNYVNNEYLETTLYSYVILKK